MTAPQVLVTGATQATVEVTAANPALVEVTAPVVPRTVEVAVPGPQGAKGDKGDTALPSAVRVDTTTAGTIYAGRAVNGASESATAWTITRSTYSPAGVRTSKGTAVNVTWTGRASHTYS